MQTEREQNPTATVDWVRRFIPEWFPAHIKKEHGKDAYALIPLAPGDVANFQMWAKYRYGVSLDTIEDIPHVELPSETQKRLVQQLSKQGRTQRKIAKEIDISKSEVARQNKGTKQTGQERILKSEGLSRLRCGHLCPLLPHRILTRCSYIFFQKNL